MRDTSPVLGGKQDPSKSSPLLYSSPPTPASKSETCVAFLLRLAGFAGWNFYNCCLLEEGCPKREMNKGSLRTAVATAPRVGLSMGQIGIADPQYEIGGLLSGLGSDKICRDRELSSPVSTSSHLAELTGSQKVCGAIGNEDSTLGWAGEQSYGNPGGPRPGKQYSLDLPEPGRTVRKKGCVNWRLTLGTGVLKGQLCPLENKLDQ